MRLIDAEILEHKLRTAIEVGRKCGLSTAELEVVLSDVETMPNVEMKKDSQYTHFEWAVVEVAITHLVKKWKYAGDSLFDLLREITNIIQDAWER